MHLPTKAPVLRGPGPQLSVAAGVGSSLAT